MTRHGIYAASFNSIYPHYFAKVEKKVRAKAENDGIFVCLTGYRLKEFAMALKRNVDCETFIAQAPILNPSRLLIKGVVCGVRVEEIKDPLKRELRYFENLIVEPPKGKAMRKILRKC